VIVFGSDPLDTDTDDDTLLDGDEVRVHTTQPALPDTDGDGLDDGQEILLTGTDALDPDMDRDAMLDGDELLVYSTDPRDRDSDDDGLDDGTEAFVTLTDPDLADSDAGGTVDGAEVGRPTDPNAPIDDDACAYPTTVRSDPTYVPPLPTIDPVYMDVAFSGIVDGGAWRDYTDLTSSKSAKVVFTFFDAGKNRLCSVDYDLSSSISAHDTWTPQGAGELYAYFDLALADGVSTCNQLDAVEFPGFSDVRDLLEAIPWGIGIGELNEHVVDLEDDVTEDGGDWTVDWVPYVMGAFVTMDRVEADEVGYVLGYAATCADVDRVGNDRVKIPSASLALADQYYESTAMDLYTMVEVLAAVP
jgi:hypothetical protein